MLKTEESFVCVNGRGLTTQRAPTEVRMISETAPAHETSFKQ